MKCYVHTRERNVRVFNDWLIQSRLLDTPDRVHQFTMGVDQLLPGFLPSCFTRVVDWLPVFLVTELSGIARESSLARAFPSRDVLCQLPDRVRAWNRMRCGLLRGDAVQQSKH